MDISFIRFIGVNGGTIEGRLDLTSSVSYFTDIGYSVLGEIDM